MAKQIVLLISNAEGEHKALPRTVAMSLREAGLTVDMFWGHDIRVHRNSLGKAHLNANYIILALSPTSQNIESRGFEDEHDMLRRAIESHPQIPIGVICDHNDQVTAPHLMNITEHIDFVAARAVNPGCSLGEIYPFATTIVEPKANALVVEICGRVQSRLNEPTRTRREAPKQMAAEIPQAGWGNPNMMD